MQKKAYKFFQIAKINMQKKTHEIIFQKKGAKKSRGVCILLIMNYCIYPSGSRTNFIYISRPSSINFLINYPTLQNFNIFVWWNFCLMKFEIFIAENLNDGIWSFLLEFEKSTLFKSYFQDNFTHFLIFWKFFQNILENSNANWKMLHPPCLFFYRSL